MVITEDRQRSIGAQGNHVQNVGKQLNESSWQDEAPTGAPAAKRRNEIPKRNSSRGKAMNPRNHTSPSADRRATGYGSILAAPFVLPWQVLAPIKTKLTRH